MAGAAPPPPPTSVEAEDMVVPRAEFNQDIPVMRKSAQPRNRQ